MRFRKIVLLLLGVTVTTQSCIIPVPVGGGVAIAITTTSGVKRTMEAFDTGCYGSPGNARRG